MAGTTSTPSIQRAFRELTRVRVRYPGLFNRSVWIRKVRARVVMTGAGGLSAVGTKEMDIVNKVW